VNALDEEPTLSEELVQEEQKKRKQEAEERRLRRLRRFFPFLLVIVFLVYAFTMNLIPSESMQPTLNPGDQILTMRSWLAYFGGRVPARGDIVIFNLPPEILSKLDKDADAPPVEESGGRKPIGVFREPPGEILIKRVVGLPGETITLKDGKLFANGVALQINYQTLPSEEGMDDMYPYGGEKPVKLESDEIFVMGDNRQVSQDSRFWGPLKLKNVRGKYVRVLFHRDLPGTSQETTVPVNRSRLPTVGRRLLPH
jgi:signal peptidase I